MSPARWQARARVRPEFTALARGTLVAMTPRMVSKTAWAMMILSGLVACSSSDGAAAGGDATSSAATDPSAAADAAASPGDDAPAPTASTLRAPPDFEIDGKTAIYVEITSASAELTIDAAAKKASVKAHMEIDVHQPNGGHPVLDVVPPTAATVIVDGGQPVPLDTVKSPDDKSTMRMVSATLAAGKHTLDFPEYALKLGKSSYNETFLEGIDFSNGFEFLTDDDDLEPRFFWERYFPVGFECHRYPFTVKVNVDDTTGAQEPDVIANGTITPSADGHGFEIAYPPNDSTSAWFLHVIDRSVWTVSTGEYESIDGRTIPIRAHSKKKEVADQAIADALVFFAELEGDYGPYPHESLLIALDGVNDAEEYDGAVQTDMDLTEETPEDRGSLGHEMLHQWFGRSARPLSGRDGWVDEGIAEWRDDGYPRAKAVKTTGHYRPIAVSSPYQRQTPDESYDQGSSLNQDLDLLLKDRGGLKPVLKAFHEKFRDKLYTTEEYLDFLRAAAPDLKDRMEPLFQLKVYAGAPVPAHP
jgi:hypothetical protein